MMNRKQIKSVLREWQTFLKEENERASAGPVVRIFDFDNTISTYKDPNIAIVLGNPYMVGFISEQFRDKLNEKADLPSNLEQILNDTGPTKRNYIISKVSSVGFTKQKPEKLIDGLKNAALGQDANFKALAELAIKPKVPNWEKLLKTGEVEKILEGAKENLNIESSEFFDQSKLSNLSVEVSQRDKIDSFLAQKGIQDKFVNIFTKDNIAQQQEVPMAGGGIKVQAVKGTSGKKPHALKIAKTAFSEFPDTLVTFEIYDNSTSNVAEIEAAILEASREDDGEQVDEKSEEGLLRALKKEISRSENVAIKKFQAVGAGKETQLIDLHNIHISKSKHEQPKGRQESGPLLKFQKIKNIFFKLTNLLKMDGRTAGTPYKKTVIALENTFKTHPSVGELVKELFSNYVSKMGTTGLEEKYSSKTEVNNLSEELFKFISDYSSFKEAIDKNKSGGAAEEPTLEIPPDEPAKTRKSTKKPALQTQPSQEPAQPMTPDGTEGDEYDDAGDDDLRESLNRFKKALKKLL